MYNHITLYIVKSRAMSGPYQGITLCELGCLDKPTMDKARPKVDGQYVIGPTSHCTCMYMCIVVVDARVYVQVRQRVASL